METQLTIRLPAELSNKINKKAKQMRLKKADIVRQALSRFLEESLEGDYPYARIKHLAGSIETGIPDLAEKHREYLKKKLLSHE